MLSTITIEVRWFKSGLIPDQVQTWFNRVCPGQLITSPEKRKDQYFPSLKGHNCSLKLREKNVELKWRMTDFGIYCFGNLTQEIGSNSVDWEGRVEKWIKWSDRDEISPIWSDLSLSHPEKNQTAWLTVKKTRWQRLYHNLTIELAQLELKGNLWWTIALEMLEKDQKLGDKEHFLRVVDEISKTWTRLSLDLSLSAPESQSYPSWLLQNYDAVK